MNSMHINTLILSVGVLFGISCGYNTRYATEVAVVSFMLFIFQVCLWIWERERESTRENNSASSFSLALCTTLFSLGMCLGIVRVQFVSEKVPYVCTTSCVFDARIITSPETKDEYQVFAIFPLQVNDTQLVQVRAPLYPEYEIGDEVKISGKVSVPKNVMSHEGDRTFDYVSYLKNKNIGSEMFYPTIEKSTSTSTLTYTEKLSRTKNIFVDDITLYVSSPASSLASGMLFGATNMTKEMTQLFRTVGLSHIIVLSGFNIAIIISAVLFLLAHIPLFVRIISASTLVIVFVVMVGGEASVVRATLMAFVSLLALLVGRRYVARQALILSLLAIVLYDPFALMHDVSLHLSFLATAGIVYLSDDLQKMLAGISYKYVRELVVTTCAAYIATLPYVMYTFGAVSLYAFFTNILVVPFVPIAMLLSFLVVVCANISSTLATVFGVTDSLLINGMIFVAHMFSYLPYASVSYMISFLTMCVMYVLIISGAVFLHNKNTNETSDRKEYPDLSEPFRF